MSERSDVLVIGAGLLGLATARALVRRGRDVTVLDQAAIGHDDSGSKGSCRIFRLGYEDAHYVALARRARELWSEIEDAAGAPLLLLPVPQLTFGEQMPTVRDALQQAGEPCELLSAEHAAERFPGVAVYGPVLLEPKSCVIAADRALAALAESIPDLRTSVRVTALADDGRQVRVSTDAGDFDAGSVIVCAGPWTRALLATAGVAVPSAATLEQVAYLIPADAEPGPAEMPIFIHYGGEFPYGLPVPGSPRYKIGIHHGGPAIAPGHQDQIADETLSRQIEQATRRFLPTFDPHPVAVERCVYDNSPDSDFIVDRTGNIVIGSGTSGHGFKFGPLFGEWLAALAVGNHPGHGAGLSDQAEAAFELPPPRFALSRFSPADHRFSRP